MTRSSLVSFLTPTAITKQPPRPPHHPSIPPPSSRDACEPRLAPSLHPSSTPLHVRSPEDPAPLPVPTPFVHLPPRSLIHIIDRASPRLASSSRGQHNSSISNGMPSNNPQSPSKPPETSISPLRAICNLPDGDPDGDGAENAVHGGGKQVNEGHSSERQLIEHGREDVGSDGGRAVESDREREKRKRKSTKL